MRNLDILAAESGEHVRVLLCREEQSYVVSCQHFRMPYPVASDLLAELQPVPAETYSVFVLDEDITNRQREGRNRKLDLIAPLLEDACIYDKSHRNEVVRQIAAEHGIARRTVLQYLWRYWVYQSKNALLPAERPAPEQHELTADEKAIRWALNKYYYTPQRQSLQTAYKMMLRAKYCDTHGTLKPEYPTFWQFRYFFRKNRDPISETISRQGLKAYQRNHRPFTGSVCDYAENLNLGYDFVTDMLVLEISLDPNKVETDREDNLWVNRAGQSLAETIRLVVSRILDVEFTELMTGYRVRKNQTGAYIDVYIYDSLSSGAGYAVAVASVMPEVLERAEALLQGCDCENACYNCLKHYRNQNVHGMLDRFAALDLLNWAKDNSLAPMLSIDMQKKLLAPLGNVLKYADIILSANGDELSVKKNLFHKALKIYPAMWKKPEAKDTIYISDACVKYAKPSAVKKIIDAIRLPFLHIRTRYRRSPLRGNGRVQNLRMVQSCGHIRKVERWRRSHKRPPPSFPVSNLSYAQVVLKVLAIV